MPEKITRRRFVREIRKHPVFVVLAMIWTALTALSVLPILLPPDKAKKFSLYPYLPRWDWHIAVIGFLVIFLLATVESYYHFYGRKVPEIEGLKSSLAEQQHIAHENSARYIRRSTEIISLEERLRIALCELEPKKRELADLYEAHTQQLQLAAKAHNDWFFADKRRRELEKTLGEANTTIERLSTPADCPIVAIFNWGAFDKDGCSWGFYLNNHGQTTGYQVMLESIDPSFAPVVINSRIVSEVHGNRTHSGHMVVWLTNIPEGE